MGLPGIILKREFVHLFLPSVCAAACVHPFIDWNPGFELPCKWFFFRVRTRVTHPPGSCSVPHRRQRPVPSSFNRRHPLSLVVPSCCAAPQHPRNGLKRNLKPEPGPAAVDADATFRCEMTRYRQTKRDPTAGILVIFDALRACVTRVPILEISRPPTPSDTRDNHCVANQSSRCYCAVKYFFFPSRPFQTLDYLDFR